MVVLQAQADELGAFYPVERRAGRRLRAIPVARLARPGQSDLDADMGVLRLVVDDRVDAVAAMQQVGFASAVHAIVAVFAVEAVGSTAAEQRVVAAAAVDRIVGAVAGDQVVEGSSDGLAEQAAQREEQPAADVLLGGAAQIERDRNAKQAEVENVVIAGDQGQVTLRP